MYCFSSESVTEGHPDKVADQVSDAILDATLTAAGAAASGVRVAVETLLKGNAAVVAGELTTTAPLSEADIERVVRGVLVDVGYDSDALGLDGKTARVTQMLTTQSAEIAAGVDGGTDTGAGDQGLMFGSATTETPEALPLPFALARRLTRALTLARRDGRLPWLRPDGKAQVTVEYPRPGEPGVVGTVVVSAQHAPDIALADVRRLLLEHVVEPTLEGTARKADLRVLLNPAGSFCPWWAGGGLWGDGSEDHRRLVWWCCPPRRRRVLGEGPDEGRPERRVHGAPARLARRAGGPRRPL